MTSGRNLWPRPSYKKIPPQASRNNPLSPWSITTYFPGRIQKTSLLGTLWCHPCEVLNPELVEIGRQRFNFSWCTVCSQKRYRTVFDLLIHKDPNGCRPDILIPIIFFDIESNTNNQHIGRTPINQYEGLDGFAPEQYRIRKSNTAKIQTLNTS